MDIYFLKKCNEIFNNTDSLSPSESVFFKSYEDYSEKNLNELFYTIQESYNSNINKQIGTVSKLITVYNIDDQIDKDNLIIEYTGRKINELDLLQIGNVNVVVSDSISPTKISVQLVDPKKTFDESQVIYKVMNYKKFYRIYKSLSQIKSCRLRNLYLPCHHLTKLTKTKLKSDFWNQEQRNVLCNVIKTTENKKIHVINGAKKTGKSTLILGLIQNYLSRYENIKLLITSSNNTSLYNLTKRLISQISVLIPNSKWLMIVGDINYIEPVLHPFVISTYVTRYQTILRLIESELQKLLDPLIDNNPIIVNITNQLDQLPIEPYSHSDITISSLLKECSTEEDYKMAISQTSIIIDKWTKSSFVNTKLILHCNLVISSICSSGCDSMELYQNRIILVDDAELMPELEALIPIQESTDQLILFGNNTIHNTKHLFNRMIKAECSVQKLSEQYNI